MASALRILMLLTDGFGGVGGIAKFNRDFLQALDICEAVEQVQAKPRLIPERIEQPIPEAVIYDRRAAAGKMAFMRRLGLELCSGGPVDLVICGHLNLLPAAWTFARLRRARLALIIHGIEAWSPSRKALVNHLPRNVDTVISVSGYTTERFTHWSKVPIDRAFILPNGVDLNQFEPGNRDPGLVERYGLQSGKVIMTMGRLESAERYKGFDQIIDVIPQLLGRFPNLKYLVVGSGPDRTRLESKVSDLGLSKNVIFTGYIPESEKVAHYNLADVYAMPSMGEGFGIVLIEAAACGVPVVGSRVDGSREALLDGELGRLVDPSEPKELIEALITVLEHERSRRRNDAIETFSIQNFRTRVADWCRAQVSSRRAA